MTRNSCVLDTDVVIGALDRADAHHAAARRLLVRLIEDDVALTMSPINYAEALVRPSERAEDLRRATDALDGLGVEVVAARAATAREAAAIRGRGISLADAFAVATARQAGVRLASFDRRVVRVARDLGVPLAGDT